VLFAQFAAPMITGYASDRSGCSISCAHVFAFRVLIVSAVLPLPLVIMAHCAEVRRREYEFKQQERDEASRLSESARLSMEIICATRRDTNPDLVSGGGFQAQAKRAPRYSHIRSGYVALPGSVNGSPPRLHQYI